jgi:Skp family chaperone for outer membrane proteins
MKNTRTALVVSLACLLTAMVVLSLPTGTIAQPAGGAAQVAVCDLGEIMNEYEWAKDMVEKLTTKKVALDAEFEIRNQAIRDQQEILMGLNDDEESREEEESAYNKQLRVCRNLMIDAQIYFETEEDRLLRRNLKFRTDMYQNILDTVADVAKAQGYRIVLVRDSRDTSANDIQDLVAKMQNRKVLYNDDAIDITDTVLGELNLAYQQR